MRHFALACVLASLTAGTAAAKPVAGAMAPRQPPPLQVVRGDDLAVARVQQRADALVACTSNGRATFLRLRATVRWDGHGKVLRANSYGGNAAVNRCVAKVLGGTIDGITGRGSAQVTYVIHRPAIAIAPPPHPSPNPEPPRPPAPPPTKVGLQTCKVDDDCTLRFQTSACVSQDPVAINKNADAKAIAAAYPVRRIECGMGGPQYEQLRMENEHRWSASCAKSQCTVVEHPQPQRSPLLPTMQ